LNESTAAEQSSAAKANVYAGSAASRRKKGDGNIASF
jgi:hypothetical protein